jgi:DNA-binding Xre family transcriptional regulator
MAEILSQRVAATVRAELARRQIKQAALATALGISAQQVSERLAGTTPIRLDELDPIAAFLELSVADLVDPPVRARAA